MPPSEPAAGPMTIAEAADYLNVSKPWVIDRVVAGEIPLDPRTMPSCSRLYWRLGRADVEAFKVAIDRKRRAALDELVRLGEELGEYDAPDRSTDR